MGEDPSYLAQVEAAFVAARGRGFMLAESDVALVESWEQQGIPVEAICRALEDGIADWRERNGDRRAPPHRLARYTDHIEDAVRGLRENLLAAPRDTSGEVATPGHDSTSDDEELQRLLHGIARCGRAATDERVRAAWRTTWRRAQTEAIGLPAVVALDLAAEWVRDTLIQALTPDEQRVLDDAVETRLEPERGRMGSDGIAIRRQAILRDEIALYFGVEELTDEP